MERDPSTDLVEFYHEAKRYLCLGHTETEKSEVNAMDYGGPFGEGFGKNKGKRKIDDGFGGSKR